MLRFSTTLEKDKIEAIAIGGFDGVHLAHQSLLSHLGAAGALLVVHKEAKEALTPDRRRCDFTHPYPCLFLHLEEVRDMEAEAFVAFLAKEFPALKKIVVGYDFRFGKERRGDTVLLQKLAPAEVVVVKEQKIDGISIHARTIKHYLKEGMVEEANRLLGREFGIKAPVIAGQGLGKERLYPTFNLDVRGYVVPKEGVYLSEVLLLKKRYRALTFVGKRLSTDGAFSIETHLLTQESLEERVEELELFFLSYMRANRRFDSLALLKSQIAKDIVEAGHYFSHRGSV